MDGLHQSIVALSTISISLIGIIGSLSWKIGNTVGKALCKIEDIKDPTDDIRELSTSVSVLSNRVTGIKDPTGDIAGLNTSVSVLSSEVNSMKNVCNNRWGVCSDRFKRIEAGQHSSVKEDDYV